MKSRFAFPNHIFLLSSLPVLFLFFSRGLFISFLFTLPYYFFLYLLCIFLVLRYFPVSHFQSYPPLPFPFCLYFSFSPPLIFYPSLYKVRAQPPRIIASDVAGELAVIYRHCVSDATSRYIPTAANMYCSSIVITAGASSGRYCITLAMIEAPRYAI